jgi:hypothetical protein
MVRRSKGQPFTPAELDRFDIMSNQPLPELARLNLDEFNRRRWEYRQVADREASYFSGTDCSFKMFARGVYVGSAAILGGGIYFEQPYAVVASITVGAFMGGFHFALADVRNDRQHVLDEANDREQRMVDYIERIQEMHGLGEPDPDAAF